MLTPRFDEQTIAGWRHTAPATKVSPYGLPRWPPAVGADTVLSAGETVTAVLEFINPMHISCPYDARVLAGTHH